MYVEGDPVSDIPLKMNRNGKMRLMGKFLVSSADFLLIMKLLIRTTTMLVVLGRIVVANAFVE